MTLTVAQGHVRSWLDRSVAQVVAPPPTYIDDVLELLRGAGSSGGNLVTDAQIAALTRAHHGVVHTADHGFRRFLGVRTHFPLDVDRRAVLDPRRSSRRRRELRD